MKPAPASPAREQHPTFERPRLPPKAVKVLLPVWGYRHLRQCLGFSIPSLLAPGNLPALAKALPCELVLMTRAEDVHVIREHPVWRRVTETCAVNTQPIDDLIVDGNHHVTITLAYAQAVRAAGDAMCDTCFIFLVSDCLVADGSLAHVLSRVRAGASGVVAGHLQIAAEDALTTLQRHVKPRGPELVLAPRELMRVAIAHPHPVMTASMVDRGIARHENANRLFWTVDADTLIGRFYLMHMIGIRPEVADFTIGASCDYSFIPEMCPSGRVEVMTDSDDYLAVEMQPRDHEARHCHREPVEARRLANRLSEWTTAHHRENVRHTLVFHARDIPANLANMNAQADAFVASVGRCLSPEPCPHHNHPYWIGALAAQRALGGRTPSREGHHAWSGVRSGLRDGLLRVLFGLRFAAFGRPPDVRPWHPRWPDFRLPLQALNLLSRDSDRLVVVSSVPGTFGYWLKDIGRETVSLDGARLRDSAARVHPALVGRFGAGLLVLLREELSSASTWIHDVRTFVRPGGLLLVVVTSDMGDSVNGLDFDTLRDAKTLMSADLRIREIRYVPESRLRRAVQQAIVHLARATRRRPLLVFPLAPLGGLLGLASVGCNWAALRARTTPPRREACSSVFMVMQVPEQGTRELHERLVTSQSVA